MVYVLWGSTYLANRFIITDLPPLFASGARFLVGGSLLALVVLAVAGRGAFRMTWPQFGTTALSGLLLPAWGNGLVTVAQQHVASGLAALLIASVPLWIVVLRTLTGDRPRRSTFLAAGDRPDLAAASASAWWAWAYMAVVVSLAAFSAYAFALAVLPVSTVATYAYVNPVIAVLLGVLVAGERFSAPQLVGGAVVLVAVVLVIAAERPRNRRGQLATSST